jgi:hypothetical protein
MRLSRRHATDEDSAGAFAERLTNSARHVPSEPGNLACGVSRTEGDLKMFFTEQR